MVLELCSKDYVPYHDGGDPFPQETLARQVTSVVIALIVLIVLISDRCHVGKESSNRLRGIAMGAAWNCCGKILRSVYQSCDNEAHHSQVNKGNVPPPGFA